jgi:hypothetical protein
MADILHTIDINSTPDKVYSAVSSNQGVKSWWTADVTGDYKRGCVLNLGFYGLGTHVDELIPDKTVKWDEWAAWLTVLGFLVRPDNNRIFCRYFDSQNKCISYSATNTFLMPSDHVYTLAKTNKSLIILGVLVLLVLVGGGIGVYLAEHQVQI